MARRAVPSACPTWRLRSDYKAVIVGVWDPSSEEEVGNAIAAWRRHPRLVVGLSLGNETVIRKAFRLRIARRAHRPRADESAGPRVVDHRTVSSVARLRPRSRCCAKSDFCSRTFTRCFNRGSRSASDETAAQFVVNVVDLLAAAYCGPILVKETGVPTAPEEAGYSESRQATFYLRTARTFAPTAARAFAYFSAFDAPWRVADSHPVPGPHPEEGHWGLFDEARRPKPVVAIIPPLQNQ